MGILRIGFALLLASAALSSAAQQALEVIALRYRTADQVLETLRPLVEPGGVLTGQGNQLILRASAANIAQIRRALDAIDRPQRRLQVSVRFDDAGEASRRELGASGAISNRSARVEVRGEDSQARVSERVDQRVQVMDGGRATILTGQSRPVRQRQYIQTPAGVVSQEVTVVQETTSGFEVIPRLSGNRVSMEIVSSRTASTASGQLGEWFELGAIGATRVWAKVETLD